MENTKNDHIKHYVSVSVADAAALSDKMRPSAKELRAVDPNVPAYVTDKHVFVHIVATSEFYNHPWYGLVNYSFDDLTQMANNHIANVRKEGIFLRKGHASWGDDGGSPAYGWYTNTPEFTRVEKIGNVDGVDVYALFVAGYYNQTGYESVVERDEFRYSSSEIHHNFVEREITSKVVELVRKRMTGEKTPGEDEDTDNADVGSVGSIKGEEYGMTFQAIALTNHPFFHLPSIKSNYSAFSSAGNSSVEPSRFAMVGSDLMVELSGAFFSMSDIESADPALAKALSEKAKERCVSVFSSGCSTIHVAVKAEENAANEQINKQEYGDVDDSNEIVHYVGEGDTQAKQVGLEIDNKEQEMNFFAMTLEQLKALDAGALSNEQKQAYEFALKSVEETERLRQLVETEKARAEQIKTQFSTQLQAKDKALADALNEAARIGETNYSLRVEKIAEKANASGIPSVVVEYASELLRDLDVSARKTEFSFSNAATQRDEKLDVASIVSSIFSKFSTEMFAGGSKPIDTENVQRVTPNPEPVVVHNNNGGNPIESMHQRMKNAGIPR